MNELTPRGPLLKPGEEPPGRWVADGKLRVWRGASDWHTTHGSAIVQWSLARVNYVWDAALPDGSRANVISTWPANDLFRRPVGETFEYGTVDVRAEDAIFMPAAEPKGPVLDVDDDVRGLFDVLIADEMFVNDLRDIDLARALYSVIENADITRADAHYAFGQRSAAHFVAALRRNGETYLDFAWGGNHEPASIANIRAHFARLGIQYPSDHP